MCQWCLFVQWSIVLKWDLKQLKQVLLMHRYFSQSIFRLCYWLRWAFLFFITVAHCFYHRVCVTAHLKHETNWTLECESHTRCNSALHNNLLERFQLTDIILNLLNCFIQHFDLIAQLVNIAEQCEILVFLLGEVTRQLIKILLLRNILKLLQNVFENFSK